MAAESPEIRIFSRMLFWSLIIIVPNATSIKTNVCIPKPATVGQPPGPAIHEPSALLVNSNVF